ncbi:uncharacterized protein [Nicotiana tomentosiformis]|uniref:uncharacterized protein n=1 Tax=Nicotiana tomentosiformis TaxID=4098 RepID=UPI00388CCD65
MLVKKTVTEEVAEKFLKKMKVQDYSIVEQLRKTPAQISLLSLLIHSDDHYKALMKILNKAHVPDKITVNQLEKIANKIFEPNRITFLDDELFMEGTEHNRALYLTMKFEESVVSRVLVDNDTSTNIFPLSTLQKLKIGTERIHMNNVCVRGLDGRGKYFVGDIMIEFSIGPIEFTMEFQVLDVFFSYNLMLGRPRIHGAKLKIIKDLGSTKLSKQYLLRRFMRENAFQRDVKKAKNQKQKVWSLPRPVPHISKSFIKPGAAKHPISLVPKPVVDIDEELIKSSFYASSNDMTCMRNFKPGLKSQSNLEIMIQEVEYDEEAVFEEISKVLKHFEEKPKHNLNETKPINLGDQNNVRETKISVHMELQVKEEIIKTMFEYKDVFAWSYDDMPGLSTDLVVHKLPTDPAFLHVKQNLRKFKTDMSMKIKEEITKQLGAKVIRVTQYPTWLANIVPVPKKDGKTRVYVDYRDLNKARPKDDFPFPNIHILIDNCAKDEIGSFVDCYVGYHQILMNEEDAEKTAFITTYCYRVMPFGLKNAGATYMRVMTTIFHDMIHKETEVYVDDVIIKSKN